jgi:hypothetical protein
MLVTNECSLKDSARAQIDCSIQNFLSSGGSIKTFDSGVLASHLAEPPPEKKVVKRSSATPYNPTATAKAEATMRLVKKGAAAGLSNAKIAEMAGVTKNYVSYLVSKNKLREPQE